MEVEPRCGLAGWASDGGTAPPRRQSATPWQKHGFAKVSGHWQRGKPRLSGPWAITRWKIPWGPSQPYLAVGQGRTVAERSWVRSLWGTEGGPVWLLS